MDQSLANQTGSLCAQPQWQRSPGGPSQRQHDLRAFTLTVEFVGEGSVDPDGTVLQWLWDFGDGFTSTAPNPIHTFTNQEAPNPTPRVVTLTVTDAEGDLDQETMLIGLDASPPEPNITSIPQGTTYGLTDDTVLELFGEVEDDDGDVAAGSWRWRTILHHNDHTHPEPWVNLQSTQTVLSPLGCGIEDYWYRIQLEVTDKIGLTGTDEVQVFPACPGCSEDLDANGEVDLEMSFDSLRLWRARRCQRRRSATSPISWWCSPSGAPASDSHRVWARWDMAEFDSIFSRRTRPSGSGRLKGRRYPPLRCSLSLRHIHLDKDCPKPR